jgi:hypothetical protein
VPLPKRKPGPGSSPSPAAKSDDPLVAARAALDRFELPPEALAKIVPSLQAGSTLIVSDLGPSIETGTGTDIVVQTKGEEAAKQSIASWAANQNADRYAENEERSSGRRARTGDWQRW